MSEASERTLLLLKELALLKECNDGKRVPARKRRKEIAQELKQIAAEKKAKTSEPPGELLKNHDLSGERISDA
jgi:hypothetical protein